MLVVRGKTKNQKPKTVLVQESRKQNVEKRRYNEIDLDKIRVNLRPISNKFLNSIIKEAYGNR